MQPQIEHSPDQLNQLNRRYYYPPLTPGMQPQIEHSPDQLNQLNRRAQAHRQPTGHPPALPGYPIPQARPLDRPHACIHSITHARIHSCMRSLMHSRIHSFTHSAACLHGCRGGATTYSPVASLFRPPDTVEYSPVARPLQPPPTVARLEAARGKNHKQDEEVPG